MSQDRMRGTPIPVAMTCRKQDSEALATRAKNFWDYISIVGISERAWGGLTLELASR